MRIDELNLIAYGKFTDHKLPFPKATHDFHIIIGPNEAGKSTVRRAITELLFGIEARSSFGFKHPQSDLRVSGVLEAAAGKLPFIRTKQQKSLRSMSEEPLADSYLDAILGPLTEQTFEQLHCLDHERLLKGGQGIVDPRNSVSQILFQAASGLEGFAAARDALAARAGELFASRGRNNEYIRLLYTNGTAWPVHLCPRRAHVHHVQQGSYQQALDSGDPPERNTVVPCGIRAARFVTGLSRADLRARHGIAPGTFVVLMVGAVKRVHKRVDHVVEEISALPGDWLLWIDGKPEDAELAAATQARLGARCRITQVASADVGQLYGLADVMVHAALEESFGLAIVEALSTGLPVLAHDSPHFAWLTAGRAGLLDMAAPGLLREQLRQRMAAPALHPTDPTQAAAITARYDWPQLKTQYLGLYQRLL